MLLNSQLVERERMIRDTAHDYCQQKLQPKSGFEANRPKRFRSRIMSELGEFRTV